MKTWSVQDAKTRFSEFLDACISDESQVVSRRGTETAVLIPLAEWKCLQSAARPSLKELLLSDTGRTDDLPIPERGSARSRKVQEFI